MGKKRVLVFAVLMCAAMALAALASCGGNSSSSAASSGSASASAKASAASASSASASSAAASASSASASSASASSASAASASVSASASASAAAAASPDRGSAASLINIDGVDVTSLSFEMVGDTPNFMVVFSNTTDKDVDVDMTPFKIKVVDGDEVSFHLTHKEVKANTPYSQNAFTASANTMKVGDKVSVFYGDTDLGTFEVAEF